MEGEIGFAQPVIVVIQVIAPLVAGQGLVNGYDGAVRVAFLEKKPGEVVHGFPAHGHGLYRHDEERLMEGGLGLVKFVEGHIDPGYIDKGQAGSISRPGMTDRAIAIAEGVVVFLICEVGIADIGVRDALALEDLVVGDMVRAKPVITKGKCCQEFFNNDFFVGVGSNQVLAPKRIPGCLIVRSIEAVTAIDQKKDKLLAGIDPESVMGISGTAAANIEDVGYLVVGVKGVGVWFSGGAFCNGLPEGRQGGFIVETFTGMRLGLTRGVFHKGQAGKEEQSQSFHDCGIGP